MPEAKAVWQSGQLLNEAVGMLVYPLVYESETAESAGSR